MLEYLRIRDFAIIEDVQLSFDRGFNVLTGETGAGKSIIIGALNAVLGERVSSENVRQGSDRAVVEAVFDVSGDEGIRALLKDAGCEGDEGQLVIKRELGADGRGRIFINGSVITLNKLKEIAVSLADIHGQHEHQSLLQIEQHIRLLDRFGSLEADVAAFSAIYDRYFDFLRRRERLRMDENEKIRMIDMLEYSLKEIEEVKPAEKEDEELEAEVNRLSHSEKLFASVDLLYESLYGREDAVLAVLGRGLAALDRVLDYDKSLAGLRNRLDSARIELGDIASEAGEYRRNSNFNPASLDKLVERLDKINRLKKKYGGTIAKVLEHASQAKKDLEGVKNNDEELRKVEEEIEKVRKELSTSAQALSGRRRVIAKILEDKIDRELADLGMKSARFRIRFTAAEAEDGIFFAEGSKRYRLHRNGMDLVEFLITTNAGEDPRPLRKVASGGELSRIMLALKTIFAAADSVDTMVFDEIDTGVSGETALIVGRKMRSIAASKQVLCITHLPAIAAKSQRHFTVMKEERGGRTLTLVKQLDENEKLMEIARIIKGRDVTEATLEHARELIGQ